MVAGEATEEFAALLPAEDATELYAAGELGELATTEVFAAGVVGAATEEYPAELATGAEATGLDAATDE